MISPICSPDIEKLLPALAECSPLSPTLKERFQPFPVTIHIRAPDAERRNRVFNCVLHSTAIPDLPNSSVPVRQIALLSPPIKIVSVSSLNCPTWQFPNQLLISDTSRVVRLIGSSPLNCLFVPVLIGRLVGRNGFVKSLEHKQEQKTALPRV